MKWVEKVLKRLGEAGLKINKENREFACKSVCFLDTLGILDRYGLRPDPKSVKPLLDMSNPKNIKSTGMLWMVLNIHRA